MKIAHIVPPANLFSLLVGKSMTMCLAQFIAADDEYSAVIRELHDRGVYIIMDNGLAEDGKPVEPAVLLAAAERINPDEIVLPDMIDPEENIRAAIAALSYEKLIEYVDDCGTKLMFVPHGPTVRLWMQNLMALAALPRRPDSIGISKFHDALHPDSCMFGRGPLGLIARGMFPDLPIHYLGLGLAPLELMYLPYGRSCDTGTAAMMALRNTTIQPMGGLFRPELEYDHTAVLSKRQEAIARHNMGVLEDLAYNYRHDRWMNG